MMKPDNVSCVYIIRVCIEQQTIFQQYIGTLGKNQV